MFLSLITKNLNWEILPKNYKLKVTFKSLREGGMCVWGGGGRGGDTPMRTVNLVITLTVILIY